MQSHAQAEVEIRLVGHGNDDALQVVVANRIEISDLQAEQRSHVWFAVQYAEVKVVRKSHGNSTHRIVHHEVPVVARGQAYLSHL